MKVSSALHVIDYRVLNTVLIKVLYERYGSWPQKCYGDGYSTGWLCHFIATRRYQFFNFRSAEACDDPVQKSKFGACSVTGYCSFKTTRDFVQSVKTVNLSLMNQKLKSVITQTLPISTAIKNKYCNAAFMCFQQACAWLTKVISEKKALYSSVNVFSTKVLIGDTILTSPTGDGTAILHGHLSHAKV